MHREIARHRPVQQCLVLNLIVGDLEQYLKHILELFSSRADEKYSHTTTTELE
jgi:hypothetical protein